MFIKKIKLLYISSKLFLAEKNINFHEARLSAAVSKGLTHKNTIRIALKTELLKKSFAEYKAIFFHLLFEIRTAT